MNHARNLILASIAAALAGCAGERLDDARFHTGSSTVVADSSYAAIVTTNPDQGSVTRVDLETRSVEEVAVGDEPTRIARAGDRLLVTLRGERAIAVLNEADLSEIARVPTGAEPYGVVASEAGDRFYVAVSQSGVVEEYDTSTLELLRSFAVAREPRWLALHPNGHDLYVGSAFGGELSWIDLDSGAVTRVEVPTVVGLSPDGSGELLPLSPRIMGDLAISPDGRTLAIPTMQLENNSPEGDLAAPNPVATRYYSPPAGGRFNSTVLTTSVVGGGLPSDDDWQARIIDATHDSLGQVTGFASSLTFTPDGDGLLLTMESSEAVVMISGRTERPSAAGFSGVVTNSNEDGTLNLVPSRAVIRRTAEGPRGIAFAGDDAYIQAYYEGTIEALDAERVERDFASIARGAAQPVNGNGRSTSSILEDGVLAFSDWVLSEDQREGRRLFNTTVDSKMVNSGAGVSCSTCHFEGRTDGLTWPLENGGRQTPSLAGGTADTEPVTWTSNIESAAMEASLTSQGRMGGTGLSLYDTERIASYLETVRPVDIAISEADAALLDRGAEVYREVGCDDCHSGARYTDNSSSDMLGLASVNTPPLTGIAATAPYFHDGSSPTLRGVVERAMAGEMGEAFELSDEDRDALVSYLRSL